MSGMMIDSIFEDETNENFEDLLDLLSLSDENKRREKMAAIRKRVKREKPENEIISTFKFMYATETLSDWLRKLRMSGIIGKPNVHYKRESGINYKNGNEKSYTVDENE